MTTVAIALFKAHIENMPDALNTKKDIDEYCKQFWNDYKEKEAKAADEAVMVVESPYNSVSYMSLIDEHYYKSPVKKWIKKLSFDNAITFEKYNKKAEFIPIANVLLDNDVNSSGKKKRETLIKFAPLIPAEEFNENQEWLYIFTVNDKMVKIGGTRDGIKARCGSYLCGHHVVERGKSGRNSVTNSMIYNTFEFYLKLGYKIQMYGYKLPIIKTTIEIDNKTYEIVVQTYHKYESVYIGNYEYNYKMELLLGKNRDQTAEKNCS